MTTWQQHYAAWHRYAQALGQDRFPETSAGGIVQEELLADETASSVRTNSANWQTLARDWRAVNDVYTDSYNGTCSR